MKLQYLLFSLLILFVFVNSIQSIYFDVGPHREECFYEMVEQGTDIGLTYQIIKGGKLDIDILITGPDGRIVYEGKKEKVGKYFFLAHAKGYFKFCFSNRMSQVTAKTVSMNLSIGKNGEKKQAKEEEKEMDDKLFETFSPLQHSILQLADGLAGIKAEEQYQRLRERVHRNTTESTNSRVLYAALFETLILISLSLWQIYNLRKFFEVRVTV
eukprot:TRINITY_DN2368_c1_g1_i1.p1 TRINITY_DN2368_c1_g1~~TRINITY_DN2368_c1_g1_i1.p1  ORF type:complete len:213 (-),score=37.67 TRINITY_DN2368_c1_g1_i1:169-807(-)